MGTAPTAKFHQPDRAAAPKEALPPRLRSVAERMRNRRNSIILSCVILFAICSGVIFAMVLELPLVLDRPPPGPADDLRTARITSESADGGCRQHVLDNGTWRLSGSTQPCETVPKDSNGVPIPVGTIHRLDAINKSFLNK